MASLGAPTMEEHPAPLMMGWAFETRVRVTRMVTWGFTDHFFTDPFPEQWLLAWQRERRGARGKYGRPGLIGRKEIWEERGLRRGAPKGLVEMAVRSILGSACL